MNEVITVIGIDRASVDAQLSIESDGRPGRTFRVLRRGEFKRARLNLIPNASITGVSGAAESEDGAILYIVIVEFW